MVTIAVYEASKDLPAVLRRVAAGEDVLLVEGDVAVARVVGEPRGTHVKRMRPAPGLMEGQIRMSEDFDAPLPDDIRKAFE
jgi:antitoxin (DNA-binding transcriptional repressor) of toxin-antitoxin stability system